MRCWNIGRENTRRPNSGSIGSSQKYWIPVLEYPAKFKTGSSNHSSRRNSKNDGTGLGLDLVQRIIRKHHGDIRFVQTGPYMLPGAAALRTSGIIWPPEPRTASGRYSPISGRSGPGFYSARNETKRFARSQIFKFSTTPTACWIGAYRLLSTRITMPVQHQGIGSERSVGISGGGQLLCHVDVRRVHHFRSTLVQREEL